MTLGEDGYNKHTQNILETTQAIAKGVQTIKGIRLLGGTPEAMIVCFAGEFSTYCLFPARVCSYPDVDDIELYLYLHTLSSHVQQSPLLHVNHSNILIPYLFFIFVF